MTGDCKESFDNTPDSLDSSWTDSDVYLKERDKREKSRVHLKTDSMLACVNGPANHVIDPRDHGGSSQTHK